MLTLSWLYNFVARAIVVLDSGIRHVVGDNGYAWALSIIVLVAAVRLVLVPLFVRQIKMQRSMQVMQPKIKELKEKYKNDKQKLNAEMIKLQKEHGNPILGCLPVLLQIPLFISLYRVMNGFAPKVTGLTSAQKAVAAMHGGYYPVHFNGLSIDQADKIAHAKIFGASLATSLLSSKHTLGLVGGNEFGTRVVAIVLIVIMVVTIYLTQKQIIGRNGLPADPTQAMTQKLMLYGSPIGLAVFGLHYSVGGLLYWFTTNLWSLGQQFIVIRRMPPALGGSGVLPATAGSAPAGGTGGSGGAGGLLAKRRPKTPPPAPAPAPRLVQQRTVSETGPASGSAPSGTGRGGAASRRKKSRRGGRR